MSANDPRVDITAARCWDGIYNVAPKVHLLFGTLMSCSREEPRGLGDCDKTLDKKGEKPRSG